MPQATEEQRTTMKRWFGDSISETGPIDFLESHGFTLLRGWTWAAPTIHHSISCYEERCLTFLICEWDFGGVDGYGTTICLCGEC